MKSEGSQVLDASGGRTAAAKHDGLGRKINTCAIICLDPTCEFIHNEPSLKIDVLMMDHTQPAQMQIRHAEYRKCPIKEWPGDKTMQRHASIPVPHSVSSGLQTATLVKDHVHVRPGGIPFKGQTKYGRQCSASAVRCRQDLAVSITRNIEDIFGPKSHKSRDEIHNVLCGAIASLFLPSLRDTLILSLSLALCLIDTSHYKGQSCSKCGAPAPLTTNGSVQEDKYTAHSPLTKPKADKLEEPCASVGSQCLSEPPRAPRFTLDGTSSSLVHCYHLNLLQTSADQDSFLVTLQSW
ncbi:hypothetical protein AXG93_2278s1170 [Marchantia polymorpha subsp. ruderalis]|uniref:Uncharacterized protein n=1 Tax=Marchantia polymorpha subsp. ruderalis TaxID=1480154 RepID=A0A176WFM4_MARPO|nr:hypothetical protein AXG93_2278s1170 [Marchantia polymorpha subsp. ruderalis]